MTVDMAETTAPGLIERAKNILTQPSAEWQRIAVETTPVGAVVMRYLLPLVFGVAAASVLGGLLMTGFFINAGMLIPLAAGAGGLIAFSVIGVLVLGFVINALAPSFGSEKNQDNAHRLAIYSSTAALAAGLTMIVPVVAFLLLIAGAIYSAILLHSGLPAMMKTPEERRIPYVLTCVGVAAVSAILLSTAHGALMQAVSSGPSYAFNREASPAEAPAAPQFREFERQAMENSNGTTVDPARVHEQLPQTLPGGFRLASSSSGVAEGMARADGVYRSGDAELRLAVMQTGTISALTNLATGMNMRESEQSGGGYSRMQTIDGRIYSEEVDNAGSSASYAIIGRGVAVTAEGSNITLDQARAAVETVGVQRLEREFGV